MHCLKVAKVVEFTSPQCPFNPHPPPPKPIHIPQKGFFAGKLSNATLKVLQGRPTGGSPFKMLTKVRTGEDVQYGIKIAIMWNFVKVLAGEMYSRAHVRKFACFHYRFHSFFAHTPKNVFLCLSLHKATHNRTTPWEDNAVSG